MESSRRTVVALGLATPLLSMSQITPPPNPLLTESSLPYQLPPFEQIKDEHFAPAFEQGMKENLAEVEAIAKNPAEPTFDNTIVALERSGALLERARRAFGIYTGAMTNPKLQEIEGAFASRFAAHDDAIRHNRPLFARLETIHAKRDSLGLDAEQKRLVERYYKDFVRRGAKLSDSDKAKLKTLNGEIANLSRQFSQNVLKEINSSAVIVDTREELDGLSEGAIQAAADAAKAQGKAGKFAIQLTNTTVQPPLALLKNRAVRERVMKASLGRGSHVGEYDNRAVVVSMVKKRAERANLLGYATHADFQLDDQTAGSVAVVNRLLAQIAPAAVANARKEASAMQEIVDAEKGGFQVAAWDWPFYEEKVRKARFAFDGSQLRPYYEIRRVLVDGVFYAATKLYGITFKERKDLKGYSPDMYVFEVFNADGSPLALFLGDFYARPNKRGGAWNNAYVPPAGLTGTKPVMGNHLNIPKPPAGEPTLLTHDEVNTMFHEFGHALHGMFSTVKYPFFAGTSVPRDFVEYPSQVNEMWATWPEIFQNYAKHYQTGKPMPKALLDKVEAADSFGQGFTTTAQVSATILDQAWYQLKAEEVPDDVLAFEAAALKKHGVDFAPVPPRYRSTYFSHIFSSGYSAGYYSYLWSEVLDADSVEWFKQHGGLKRANGDHFRKTLLSRGGSVDAMELYRAFRGADPDPKPFLKRRALEAK
jgi:peptidyl-dipeptidase Dcp